MLTKPSFSDWLEQEVEPKLVLIRGHLEKTLGLSAAERELYAAELVRHGVSPFVYWQRDRVSSLVPESTTQGTSPPASNLSLGRPEPRLADQLGKFDVIWEDDKKAYTTGGYLKPEAWSEANSLMRGAGFVWSKDVRGWVRA